MSRKQWLLVQWVEERNVLPNYGVVRTDSLLSEEHDLHPSKTVFVRTKHGNSAIQAQILKISDDKRHLKEHKLFLERQDHQVQNMISLCMRTIREIKTEPLVHSMHPSGDHVTTGWFCVNDNYGISLIIPLREPKRTSGVSQGITYITKEIGWTNSGEAARQRQSAERESKNDAPSHHNIAVMLDPYNSSQLINNGASGSGIVPKKIPLSNSSSSSDSDEDLTNETQNLQITKSTIKTPAQLKRITDCCTNERAESPTANNHVHKRRFVTSSTPLPTRCHGKDAPKLTFDQATQTDDIPSQVPVAKIEQMESVLGLLYRQFLTLVGRLQLDCQDYVTYNSDDQNGTATSDRVNQSCEQTFDNNRGQNLNNSTFEPQSQYNPSAKCLQVRRVSAHTTNTVEQNNPNDMVPIGLGTAMVPTRLMNDINWDSYSSATRQLLQAVFPRKVLATHSLTGKKSPAFANKPAKKCLDPKLIDDIVDTVSERCGVPKRTVRNCITIKCTDEAKLYRNRMQARLSNMEPAAPENQENVPPSPVTSHVSSNESG